MNFQSSKFRYAVIIGGAIALIAAAAIALVALPRSADSKMLHVGAILPLTGDLAFLGEGNRNALTLFGEQNPDVAIRIEDSRGTPKDGLAAANKLLSGGTRYFITSLSFIVSAIQPTLDDNKALNMTLSMDEAAEKNNVHCLRLYTSFIDEMDILQRLVSTTKAQSVAVLHTNAPAAQYAVETHLRPKLEASGVKLTAESFELGTRDFKPMLLKLKEQKPDIVRVLDIGTNLPTILSQAAEVGAFSEARHITSGLETLFVDPSALPESFRKRFIFSVPPQVLSDNEFSKAYKLKYGVPPTYDAMFSYDAVALLAEHARLASASSPEAVFASIVASKTYTGVAATYNINGDGGISPIIAWAHFGDNGVPAVLAVEQ